MKDNYSTWQDDKLLATFNVINSFSLFLEPDINAMQWEIGAELNRRYPNDKRFKFYAPKMDATPGSFAFEVEDALRDKAAQNNKAAKQDNAFTPTDIPNQGNLNEPLDPKYVSKITITLSPSVIDPSGSSYGVISFEDVRGYKHYSIHIPKKMLNEQSDDGFFLLTHLLNRFIARRKNGNEYNVVKPPKLSPSAESYLKGRQEAFAEVLRFIDEPLNNRRVTKELLEDKLLELKNQLT